ncbi:acyl-CoA dehydrogenase family protein [Ammoniphilus sp. CFH 90114]|uniref:acyl-CoA dehydrogenase family protein n=1 Tax=Ammoniphilus sp. CFH 90114 TaxID=2493665 RepID=UPI00100FAE3A|nr:acyl-CoA dehydrogenase family protein [Ammoniphilus sp. CFH 90114]RXT02328.1 acyl-CoA dehydrogenase [Ammoniphilus sp. CFH 90114]
MMSRGGGFVLESTPAENVFTPEDFTEEHKMIASLTQDFVEGEVLPHDEEIEGQNFPLLVELMKKAGELGLLGAEVPEPYGGSDLDKISSTLITEHLSRGSSFTLTHGAHVGIGSLPIVLFGTEKQKKQYLPDLATGEKIAAYCLTEPSSGSDALGAKTTAVLSDDGDYYILNGTKQYITNAAFADVFVVYAKIDGQKFSAFIVEREYPGVSTGPEEKKMGIKGSSTRPLILEDVKVPVENLLGEVGKGHIIAFNILNIGRYKLAAGCVGACKWTVELATTYATERKQFNKSLVEFPLMQKKLADLAIRTYVTESMVYRTGGLIDAAMQQLDKSAPDYSEKIGKAVEEYALECSINKVYASESLDFVADEGVQIHGGYGYTQDYKVERIYRDSRINRIFEGTNEINRLLIPATLFRKAMKGELPLFAAAKSLQDDLISYIPPIIDEEEILAKETAMLDSAKKILLMAGGSAVMKYQQNLEEEQEILESLANLMIEVFAMESAILRTKKATQRDGVQKSSHKINMTTAYVHAAFTNIETTAKEVLTAISEGDHLLMQLSILKKLVRFKPMNLIPLKREIAKKLIKNKKYVTS